MGFAYVIHGGSGQKRIFEFVNSGFRKRSEIGSQKAEESGIEIHVLADIFGHRPLLLSKVKN